MMLKYSAGFCSLLEPASKVLRFQHSLSMVKGYAGVVTLSGLRLPACRIGRKFL